MFRKINKFFIDFFCNTKIYKGSLVLFGRSYYGLKGSDWRKVLDIIKPDDYAKTSDFFELVWKKG